MMIFSDITQLTIDNPDVVIKGIEGPEVLLFDSRNPDSAYTYVNCELYINHLGQDKLLWTN